jgi:uncharacterized membrane protein SpoIIM required for sporulation
MLEMLINPKKAEKRPIEMLFIGFFYAALSVLLVMWIFSGDPVLSKYSGILIVTFSVMFSTPFMYYTIKLEEKKDIEIQGSFRLLKEHSKALLSFIWLFLGFVLAFSLLYIIFPNSNLFSAQIETFCMINHPNSFSECTSQYGISSPLTSATGAFTSEERILNIFANNVYVLIFTLIFSLIFGAGAIFILSWNASVISAAIGIFTRFDISALPNGILRYLVHGIPEISSYFIAALAGGIISIAVIRHDIKSEKFWRILQDSLNLIIVAIIILIIAALIEVFITPSLF